MNARIPILFVTMFMASAAAASDWPEPEVRVDEFDEEASVHLSSEFDETGHSSILSFSCYEAGKPDRRDRRKVASVFLGNGDHHDVNLHKVSLEFGYRIDNGKPFDNSKVRYGQMFRVTTSSHYSSFGFIKTGNLRYPRDWIEELGRGKQHVKIRLDTSGGRRVFKWSLNGFRKNYIKFLRLCKNPEAK